MENTIHHKLNNNNKLTSLQDLGIACTVCRNEELQTTIDFGLQPPANRFLSSQSEERNEVKFALGFGYCKKCGTAQLTHRMPFESIRPRFDWLLYNEPEGHLDEASLEMSKLPNLNSKSKILGVTYKDQSTVDRLKKHGFVEGRCIDEKDFNLNDSAPFGLETIQSLLRNKKVIDDLKSKYGKVDILIMRHIIEHSDNAAELLLSLKHLLSENGYLVMELPDSNKIFSSSNHAFIWEEHISYFTEENLYILAKEVGANISWFKRSVYPYEDSLMVAFSFKAHASSTQLTKSELLGIEKNIINFSKAFEQSRDSWKNKLESFRASGKKIAVFGAGHLAAKFINFLGLRELIDCVIDDNPNKLSMKMPGSLLPIVSSQSIPERGIDICISTLNPESEVKVRAKLLNQNINVKLIPAFSIVGSE